MWTLCARAQKFFAARHTASRFSVVACRAETMFHCILKEITRGQVTPRTGIKIPAAWTGSQKPAAEVKGGVKKESAARAREILN